MVRFRPGTRVRYRDGVIYQVAPDGSHRREDGGKMTKAEKKAAKKQRMASRQAPRRPDENL
jgi:hypothetical protein